MYIDSETMVGNFFIETIENLGLRYIKVSELDEYASYVIKKLSNDNDNDIIYNDDIKLCIINNMEYFDLKYMKDGAYIFLNDNITIEDLWKRFRGYLSLKVLNVFMDKKILDIIFKEYKDIKNENKTMICK